MTIKEFDSKIVKIDKVISKKVFDKVRAYAGLTLIADISNRVVNTQTNAKGGAFPRYSDKPILSSGETERGKQVWRELASSPSKRRELKWVTIKKAGKNIHLFEVPGGYAEIRRIHGFSNANKSYEFTGEMWKKFGVVSSKIKQSGFLIRLAGKTPAAQKKIDANSARDGVNIIDISKGEEKELGIYIDKWIEKEINKML